MGNTACAAHLGGGGTKRRRLTKLERFLLYRRSNGICAICGKPMTSAECEMDHVVPFRFTRRTVMSEMQATHGVCNRSKGGKI